jgi:hypothetical protein
MPYAPKWEQQEKEREVYAYLTYSTLYNLNNWPELKETGT